MLVLPCSMLIQTVQRPCFFDGSSIEISLSVRSYGSDWHDSDFEHNEGTR
jgi:hypothetical protein